MRWFSGKPYVMETGLRADFALVKAWKADTAGNLVFRRTARNFAPMMCQAARRTIVEAEHLVPAGDRPRRRSTRPASSCSASSRERATRSASSGGPLRGEGETEIDPSARAS